MTCRTLCCFSSLISLSKKNRLPSSWRIALMLFGLLLSLPLQAQSHYSVTTLDLQPSAINARGHITGVSTHAVLWTPEHGSQDLGTLSGDYSGGEAINNQDEVAGVSSTASGASHACLWRKGKIIDLGTLGGTNSIAFGLNDRGQVVGRSDTADGRQHAFLWQNGVMRDIDTFGGNFSVANAINNWGVIVGGAQASSSSFDTIGFVWTPFTGMVNIGTGGPFAQANAINNWGEVVGGRYLNFFSEQHAFVWTALFGLQDIAAAGDQATATGINDRGDILLWTDKALLYSRGKVYDLNTLVTAGTPLLYQPKGVNNRGQIIVLGLGEGNFLLTPH